MKDLRLFASPEYPLHPSGLRALIMCTWRSVLPFLEPFEDEGGVAGDTGSAMHHAAAEMHRGKEAAECIASMGANIAKYPKADLMDAANLFLKYAADDRNRTADVVLVEAAIAFQIAPAPEDPTQAPIAVIGTVDQVRLKDGVYRVWDIKTTKKDPVLTLYQSTFQAAAYCIGASIALGKQVEPGGLIMPRIYKERDPSSAPVHREFAWSFKDIEDILKSIRHMVALVRSGTLWHVPGEHCDWCHAKSPDLCLPKLQQLNIVLRK